MEKGDLVLVNYIGETDGEIFDLTVEEKAKEEGMYSEEMNYDPIPVLVGEGYVIEGLEEALEGLDVGTEKNIEIEAEKAYGNRDSENVEKYPKREFERQDVQVRQGEQIMVGNRRGRVLSVSSGRVRIDFNHPLAGKDLKYWIEVKEKVEDGEEKAGYIADRVAGHFDSKVEDGVLKVEEVHSHDGHEHEMPEETREELERQVEEYTDLELKFVEEIG